MDFGDVIKDMMKHPERKFTRWGWNGKHQYIMLQTPDMNSKMTVPYIYLRNTQGEFVPWQPSQEDVLATDWAYVCDDGTLALSYNIDAPPITISEELKKEAMEKSRMCKFDNQPNPNGPKNTVPEVISPTLKLTAVGYNCGTYEDFKNMNQSSGVKKKMREAIQLDKDLVDLVHSPAHYTKGRKYEPWEVIIDWELDFFLGTALKYIARAGRKQYAGMTMRQSEETDLMKAIEYLQERLNTLRERDAGQL